MRQNTYNEELLDVSIIINYRELFFSYEFNYYLQI